MTFSNEALPPSSPLTYSATLAPLGQLIGLRGLIGT